MSLEDEIQDVVGKAMRGAGLSVDELAEAAGLDDSDIKAALAGDAESSALQAIAGALGLDGQCLLGLTNYLPEVSPLAGVQRIEVPFRDWTVNAWLLEHDGVKLLFDTGWNDGDVAERVDAGALDAVFITHAHPDHVGGVEPFLERGCRVISETEAQELKSIRFGGVEIQAMDLSGHCVPATGYLVKGFARPLWVVGDAIFAGSMGGCSSPERCQQAFSTLRNGFAELGDETLILPGHGPMTSIGQERVFNPFHPRFVSA